MLVAIKGIVLLAFILAQFLAYAQNQEVYRKEYFLKDEVSSSRTKKLEKDRVINVSSLTAPVAAKNGIPALKEEIKTAFFTISVLSLPNGKVITLSDDKTKIIIPKDAKVEETYITPLLKVAPVEFKDMSNGQQDSIRSVYPIGSVIKYTVERKVPTGKVTVEETLVVTENFIQTRTLSKVVVAEAPTERGYVKFDEDKVWVNPNLIASVDQGLHYYQLKNRFSMKLRTREYSLSALTLPLKYRFKGEKNNGKAFAEDFTADINVSFFAGKSWGGTSFHYREKVGNISNTWKWTVGPIIGGSTVKLNKSNTASSDTPITDDTEITKGLLSVGFGGTYSFNKATFGLFLGSDYSIGKDAKRWDYNRKPWLGFAIGYSILSI